MSRFAIAGILTALSVFCTASVTSAAVLVYEGFDYANDGLGIVGREGGTGWSGAWLDQGLGGTGFTVPNSAGSLTSPIFPFTATGNALTAVGAGSGSNSMRTGRILPQPFDLSAEGGALYSSFLMRKDQDPTPGTAGNNMEYSFTVNESGNGTVRFGVNSGNQFFFHNAGGTPPTFRNAEVGTTYFVVLRTLSHATDPDKYSAIIFDPTQAVPTTEPVEASWDVHRDFNQSEIVTRARLWIGTIAGGLYDEIRVGQTWADVTSPSTAAHPGDFNGDGDVDGTDFVVWQANFPKQSGATLVQGDADGDGDVDGADFVVWQTNFPFTPEAAAAPVPEPAGFLLLIAGVATIGALALRRRPRPVAIRLSDSN